MTGHQAAVGVDVGTGGVRAMALDLRGAVLASAEVKFPSGTTVVSGACVEQNPQAWTAATQSALRLLAEQLDPDTQWTGVSVDATSGTFLLLDEQYQPLTPGIMYNDQRAVAETAEVAELLDAQLARFGISIASSFAIPKIVHLQRARPELWDRCRHIVHQTDWIVGLLTGDYGVTDISTALKTGADPASLGWPTALEQLGVSHALLPRIVLPGLPIGQVTQRAAQQTGLPAGTPVVAGCTDGTAGCLASGARLSGELNVTLGTTLVFKGISPQPIVDPAGAIYNHRHPAGGYLPGAASSTGGDWIEALFVGADLQALGREAVLRVPTGKIVYPLIKQGERFPFACPAAQGFGLDQLEDPPLRLAAGMEAVALLERMAIERFQQLGLPIGPTVFATGGGATSDHWLRIRASATGRTYAVPENAACVVGAAVLAATPTLGSCEAAIAALVRRGRTVEPQAAWQAPLDDAYHQLRAALQQRGYI